MRRTIIACLTALLAIGVLAGPVSAHGKSLGPPDAVTEWGAGEVCSFAIRLEDWGRERVRTFVDRNGVERSVVHGRWKTRITNLETGDRIWVRHRPHVMFWEPGDGTWRLKGHGRILFYFLAGDQNPKGEGPGLFLVSGRVRETLDLASGVVTKFKYHGKARDLCARVG
jgi:hypothetical protein